MDQDTISKLPNIDKLLSLLISKGFTEKVSLEQINELSEIIWLSALARVAKEKKLDLSKINSLDGREKLGYINKNISEEELSRALEIESEEKISGYLKSIE